MSHVETAAPRRRPVEGGYARGEETRARIVAAALEVFAEEGFVRASTRKIAAEAGVNPPALQYYFDGKEGLHRACAELIVTYCSTALAPAMAAGEAALTAGGYERALEALCGLVDVMADLTLEGVNTPSWRRFMARAEADNAGPAYAYVKETLSAPMHNLAVRLVAATTGLSPEEPDVKLRALMLHSQLSALHHHRDHALAALGWGSLGPEELAQVKAVARAQTRDSLLALRARLAAGA